MADIKITVATPAFGEMFFTPYVQSLLRLQRAVYQRNWTMRHATIAYAYIGEARNYLLTHWFDKTELLTSFIRRCRYGFRAAARF